MRWLGGLLLVVCPMLAWGQADAPDAGPSAYAEADAAHAHRERPVDLERLLALTAAGVRDHPDDFEWVWRAARAKLWLADGETNSDRKQKLGKEVWELGDRAVKLRPDAVAGHYYAAAGIGSYSQAVGILKALSQGLESKFNERLDRAIALDSAFQHAKPLIAKGRYYSELPWPKRNLGKSADSYRKALAVDPPNLRALVWLAETQLRDGKASEAKETLARAMAGHLPDDPAEEQRVHGFGRRLEPEIQKELK